MLRTDRAAAAMLFVVAMLASAAPSSAQALRGTVVDGSNDRPVALAGVHLLDAERNTLLVAVSDSLGRYALTVPDSGAYFLVAERFGYEDTESPLLAVSNTRDYILDLELRPAPLGLGRLTVTVRNEDALKWLTREFGRNPAEFPGFRLLQGDRLAVAKAKGAGDPTNTLRWLYVPVSHGPRCVAINATPRAVRTGWHANDGQTVVGDPGSAPSGTSAPESPPADEDAGRCGTLRVNDRVVPNEHLEEVDMSSIAVIIALPGSLRMYTWDFGWSFR